MASDVKMYTTLVAIENSASNTSNLRPGCRPRSRS